MKYWKTIKKGDYLYAKVPNHPNATKNGYVLEHRVVMEEFLGRYLSKSEVVHHKDGNKHNNDITNLEIMSVSDHASLHNKTGRTFVNITCKHCGKEFRREKRLCGRYNDAFCSRKCSGYYNLHIRKTQE